MKINLDTFSHSIAKLIPAVQSHCFPELVIAFLKDYIHFDRASIFIYCAGKDPALEYCSHTTVKTNIHLHTFMQGACYHHRVNQKAAGAYLLNGMASRELGYLIPISDQMSVNIALGRIGSCPPLTVENTDVMESIYPMLREFCRLHWIPEQQSLHDQLSCALQNFGRSQLSKREVDVTGLALQGHSTKSIARKLAITADTVRLHKKNIYAKLDISSQGELFHMFIDSLTSTEHYSGGDPLISYLGPVKH